MRTITVSAGTTLSFDYNFLTDEPMTSPLDAVNDFAFLTSPQELVGRCRRVARERQQRVRGVQRGRIRVGVGHERGDGVAHHGRRTCYGSRAAALMQAA